jgi:type IV secretory pathway VirB6-like protein
MNFQIRSLDNGQVKICDLSNLSRSLMVNCEVIKIDGDKVEAIGFVNHHLLTFFATEFADYSLKNYVKKPIKEAEYCISLLRKWLDDPSSVSNEELKAAYAAAYAYADAYAAYAADAFYSANHAAYAAARAADAAAANAADAAADAAYAVANAAKSKEEEFIRQGEFILHHMKSGKALFNI